MTVINYETYQMTPNFPPHFCTAFPHARNRFLRKQEANGGIAEINPFSS